MKKLSLLCFAVVAFLATACQKNVQPTLSLTAGNEYVSQGDEVEAGTEVWFGFQCTGNKLETLKVTISGPLGTISSDSCLLNGAESANETIKVVINQLGTISMNAVLEDAKGQKATASLTFECVGQPNAFFVGNYQGVAFVEGTVASTSVPYSYPISTDVMPVSAIISAGEQADQVVIELNYDGIVYSTTGIIEGNHVDFEPFDINLVIDGSSYNGTLDLEGEKTADVLDVTGAVEASGNAYVEGFPVSIPVILSGTVHGEMNLLR